MASSSTIVRNILDEVLYKVYRYCTTEYSVPKEQKNMPPALLGGSDDKIDVIAKRDFYAEQQITMKKIYRRVARETVRDLIILATKQANASPDKGQLATTSQFRFANYEAQKYAYQQQMENKRVKIHKKLQVKVTVGSEIVQYTLRPPTNRTKVAEGNMEIQKSYEAQREITPKEDDPEPKGWRKLLCCGKPQKKQAKEKRKKLGLLNRLCQFFARR
ncbi:uncharacterized protein LOC134279632 [Saccostrea cucullata]|uniref:uncharacterized protein LOC134279632 n=1 Tax=Saccostrea cuccullata TaxID=36930 RepID=UPI002ED3F324